MESFLLCILSLERNFKLVSKSCEKEKEKLHLRRSQRLKDKAQEKNKSRQEQVRQDPKPEPPKKPEEPNSGKEYKLPFRDENAKRHTFRKAEGHFEKDTAKARQEIDKTFKEKHFDKIDKYGNKWYSRINERNEQVWVRVRYGKITDAGVNKETRLVDSDSGLCKNIKGKK